MLTPSATVCIIGFGEAGRALAAGMAQRGHAVRAWDPQLQDPAACQQMRQRIESALVDVAYTMAEAMHGAKLVVVAVGAATGVKRDVAALLVAGQLLLDLDSTSPAAQLEMLGFAYDPQARQVSHRGELP